MSDILLNNNMANQEIEKIERLRSEIQKKLDNRNWEVESQVMITKNNRRHWLDIVVKYNRDVVTIFEYKSCIKVISDTIIKRCNIFRDLFPQSSPAVYLTDGDICVEVYKNGSIAKRHDENIDKVIETISNKMSISAEPDYASFIKELKNFKIDEVIKFAEKIENGDSKCFFEVNSNTFSFNAEYERLFFKTLLGNVPDVLYRYTSLDNVLRLLSELKQSMVSLLGMTDFTECYYANNYVSSIIEMDTSTDIYKKATRCFILSFSVGENENMKMWEDYGDKYKGVRIRYQRRGDSVNNSFWIAPVCYAVSKDKHPKLDFIAKIQRSYGQATFKINQWDIWQHFFKPYDYRDEEEVRILYSCKDLQDENGLKDDAWKWKNQDGKLFPLLLFESDEFPYTISEIMLGPIDADMFERNKAVLEQMILVNKANDIKVISSKYNEKNRG